MTKTNQGGVAAETVMAVVDHWSTIAPDDRLAHLIRHVARGLRRSLELRLSEHEISFGHWSFLRILWRQDGVSQRQLTVLAGVMAPTTHTAIHKMEALGLVERRVPSADAKRPRIFLTEKGRRLETVLVPLAEEANAVATAGIEDDDIVRLRVTLLTMVKNLAWDEQAALDLGMRITPTREQTQDRETK